MNFHFNQSTRLILGTIGLTISTGASALNEVSSTFVGGDFTELESAKDRLVDLRDELSISNGLSALFLESLIDAQGVTTLPTDAKNGACKVALQQKKAELAAIQSPTTGDSFGKILDGHTIAPDKEDPKTWRGEMELCSWFGNDEYHIKFQFGDKGGLSFSEKKTEDDPFPDTISYLPNEPDGLNEQGSEALIGMLAQWNYKLHAKQGDYTLAGVSKNDSVIDVDQLQQDLEGSECVDMLFINKPHQIPQPELFKITDSGFCMGRCNAIFVNTM